jgi:hypothetical protein
MRERYVRETEMILAKLYTDLTELIKPTTHITEYIDDELSPRQKG